MKTNIRIPGNLYTTLYDEIMKIEFNPEYESDNTLYGLEIEIGDFVVYLDATFDLELDNDGDIECCDLNDIEVEAVIHFDKDFNETDVTEQFDYSKFWSQLKKYVIKSKDIYIHHGDEVVVRVDRIGNYYWQKMIYLYTDLRTFRHICTRHLGSKVTHSFQVILPATTGALSIVGDYRFSSIKKV